MKITILQSSLHSVKFNMIARHFSYGFFKLESLLNILSFYISMALQPLLDLGWFFSSLILDTVGRTPWTEDQSFAKPLPTHRTAQTQNKRTQTSMP
jgi:hypothetical protein